VTETTEKKLGKYIVRRELGRGATSRVLLGHDPFSDKDVAIKVMFDEPNVDEDTRRMRERAFVVEAALVGTLNHPHICAIYDAVTEAKYRYIVMEYVGGGTLEKYIEPDTLLPVFRIIEIVFKCARALDIAVHSGVIHRDIKPANIMLDDDGDIRITDFGAAMKVETDGHSTQVISSAQEDEGIVGSPAYMSPEQILGEPLNHQTDIYSLGMVMYRLLTGRMPYGGETAMELAVAVVNATPEPPTRHRPEVPELVERIVLRALQKDRAMRYAKWSDFCRDLSQAFELLKSEEHDTTDTEKFEALQTLPFFGAFEDAALWEVLKVSTWHEMEAGTSILREGEEGDSIFVLVDGILDVTVQGKPVGHIRRGDCFGEMSYFGARGSKTRSSTVTAQTDCDAIEISAPGMQAAPDRVQAAFVSAVMRVLVARIEQANQRMVLMSA
jgi:serine/threonine protein kinase